MDDLHERDGSLPARVRSESHPGLIAHETHGTRNPGAGNRPPPAIKEATHDHDQSGSARARPG